MNSLSCFHCKFALHEMHLLEFHYQVKAHCQRLVGNYFWTVLDHMLSLCSRLIIMLKGGRDSCVKEELSGPVKNDGKSWKLLHTSIGIRKLWNLFCYHFSAFGLKWH